MSRKYYRRRSGGSSKGFNVMQIVLSIVTIALLISVIPALAAITGNPIVRPTEPVDDGLIHFKVYTTVHPYGCDGETCYDDYVEFTCEEGLTWVQFACSDASRDSISYSTDPDYAYVGACYTTDDGGHDAYSFPDVKPTDLIVDGAVYGSPDLCT